MKSISLCLICFLVLSCSTSPAKKQHRPPNIIFLMSDDHTSQAWGIYGGVLEQYAVNQNIKRLAAEGVVLDNAFCTNSICVPSRASILTGQYSHNNQVFTLTDALDPNRQNVARLIQKSGYQTALIGKWHLKDKPSGFDHFNILPGQGRYHNPILKNNDNWEYGNKGGKEYKGFSADVIMDESLKWLDQRDKEKPFMLMTHFKATHEPFDYPERFRNLFENDTIPEPVSLLDFDPQQSGRSFDGQILEILAERWRKASIKDNDRYPGLPFDTQGLNAVQSRKKTYQKFVKDFLKSAAAIDDNIGRMLKYLDENGLTENTLIIYTSDQGYFLGEHGMFDKRMFLEESARMPFVIRYPEQIPAGKRVNDIILNIDFPSLLLDYAGIPQPDQFQGESFRKNLIMETPDQWRDKMYYRYYAHSINRPAHLGIRTDRNKLIFYYGLSLGLKGTYTDKATPPSWEFYDLVNDPLELKNQYDNPNYQSTIKELKNQLIQLREDFGDSQIDSPEMQNVISKSW
jgi:arylsulfatase A-like enzyme